MSFDPASAAVAVPPEMLQPRSVDVSYNASMSQAVGFQNALHTTSLTAPQGPEAMSPVMKGMLGTLEKVNGQASDIAALAQSAEAKGSGMTPGEMIMMTVRCHEFMFNCQLTSNMANRTSDGLQQLFRQQA